VTLGALTLAFGLFATVSISAAEPLRKAEAKEETKTIAEMRITGSKISASFTQASDLLNTVATLAFSSIIVTAPGDQDHVALDSTASEKAACIARLRRNVGDLGKQDTLPGADLAGHTLMLAFDQDWRLAR
jgi:hypothetical protein